MGYWKKILTSAQEGNSQAQKIVAEFNKQRKELEKSHISRDLMSKIEVVLAEDLNLSG